MIIYEVNTQISTTIVDSYLEWLREHVAEMLAFSGFKKASILKELRTHEEDVVKITVQYVVESLSEFDDYLENHAQRMREDAFNKFSQGFSATRRLFKVIQ